MKQQSSILVIAMLGLAMPVQATEPEPPAMVQVPRLSMDAALKLANATMAACRKEGVHIAVTVVDRSGDTQVVLRDTMAMELTLVISRQKAYTAMTFNSPTSKLDGRFPGPYSVPKVDGVLIAAGGLPVTGGGAILGGVGVSGAPSGITDEKCAKAGLDAISFDLE